MAFTTLKRTTQLIKELLYNIINAYGQFSPNEGFFKKQNNMETEKK